MQKLAEICIRRPVFATMIVLSLVVVGTAGFFKLGVDRFPSVESSNSECPHKSSRCGSGKKSSRWSPSKLKK